MKLSENNKEAIKSSVLAGLAYGLLAGGVLLAGGRDWWILGGCVMFVVGLFTGLLTMYDIGEE